VGDLSRTWWWSAGRDLLRRPGLWPTALVQARRIAHPGWWRRPPFLPLPDPVYLRFRMETAYGPGGEPEAADVVAYLGWCRDFSRRCRRA
jgi:hypothetical protein